MPSVVAKRPKIPSGVLGRRADSIVKYHTKVDDKGVKKRHKISIPAVWVSHLEKGEAKLIRENVVDYEMVEVRQKWPTLDTQGNEVYVFLI